MRSMGWLRRGLVLLVLLFVPGLLAACSASSSDAPAMPAGAPAPQDGGGAVPQEGGGGEPERLVIRTKTLRLEVGSTPEAVTKVRALASQASGVVTDLQVATETDEWLYRQYEDGTPAGDGTALRGWVTVRVPVAGYEQFIDDVAALGKVKYQSEASEDVTQQHVDLSARLENLRAQEVRLRAFFDAAKTVEEMIAVEKELGRVRGDIESLDAQIKLLERQAAMATVTIELIEPRPVTSSLGLGQAFGQGVDGAVALVSGILIVLVATSPFWIVGLLAFYPVRAWIRRRRAGRQAAASETS